MLLNLLTGDASDFSTVSFTSSVGAAVVFVVRELPALGPPKLGLWKRFLEPNFGASVDSAAPDGASVVVDAFPWNRKRFGLRPAVNAPRPRGASVVVVVVVVSGSAQFIVVFIIIFIIPLVSFDLLFMQTLLLKSRNSNLLMIKEVNSAEPTELI